jgi:hypothetical protein
MPTTEGAMWFWRLLKTLVVVVILLWLFGPTVIAMIMYPKSAGQLLATRLDQIIFGTFNWLASPGADGHDPRIILIGLLLLLVWLASFAFNKMTGNMRTAIHPPKKDDGKKKKDKH